MISCYLCRVRAVRVLCAVGERGHAPAQNGSTACETLQDVGLSGDPDRLHRLRDLAGLQHDRRDAARFGYRCGAYSAGVAGVLVLEETTVGTATVEKRR